MQKMVFMRAQSIYFPDGQTLCVFPMERSNLPQAVSELRLKNHAYPVIVLIGGQINEEQAEPTRRAVQTIARVAEDMEAAVLCGGTDMGVMAEIGQARSRNYYKFPLIGVAPEDLVTWPGGPPGIKVLGWGKERWQLESNHSHFVLVPGSHFGDESPWIVDIAKTLAKDQQSVTILINGGEVSRKDIELSLKNGRRVVVLSGTGRLADELATQTNRHKLITVVPANDEYQIAEVLRAFLSVWGRNVPVQEVLISAPLRK